MANRKGSHRSTGATTTSTRRRPTVGWFLLGVLAGVVAVPSITMAADAFPDVGDTNPFHDDIGAFAGAGITGGYPDGGFHPSAQVSRQAMAAFLHRGLPRLAHDETVDDVSSDVERTIGQADLTLDGTTGGVQGVKVSVTMRVRHDAVTSDCELGFEVFKDVVPIESWDLAIDPSTGPFDHNVSFTAHTTQSTGTTETYRLRAQNDCSSTMVTDHDLLTVENYVFDGQGNPLGGP